MEWDGTRLAARRPLHPQEPGDDRDQCAAGEQNDYSPVISRPGGSAGGPAPRTPGSWPDRTGSKGSSRCPSPPPCSALGRGSGPCSMAGQTRKSGPPAKGERTGVRGNGAISFLPCAPAREAAMRRQLRCAGRGPGEHVRGRRRHDRVGAAQRGLSQAPAQDRGHGKRFQGAPRYHHVG
jgi:hypothetical protein